MDVLDFILFPLYYFIFYLLAKRTAENNSHNPLYRLYYLNGVNYRLIGAALFAAVYVFYYKGGDSTNFFYAMRSVAKLAFTNPSTFIEFIINPKLNYPSECAAEAGQLSIVYLVHGVPSLTTIRIGSILSLVCFNSYFTLCLMFAYIAFQFQWKVFTLLCTIYPAMHRQLAYAFLMFPSVLFWGSGVGKDTIMLASIMLFFYSFYQLVLAKKKMWRNFLVLLATAYVISLIRGFILYTLLPCCVLMAVVYYRTVIKSPFLRFIAGPVLLLVGAALSIFFVRSLGDAVQSYSIDSLQQKAEGFKSWHTYLGETEGGSAYSLGDVEYTPVAILSKAPLAIIITLFGPFVWEIRNFVMLLSGTEGIVLLYLSIKLFFSRGVYRIIGAIMDDHVLVFCIPFVLILSVAIGLTSFNYGALVRYKIPILPFFATILIILQYRFNRFDTK